MKVTILAALIAGTFCAFSQSKTTQALEKKFDDDQVQTFFFYHNTLRMINQEEDPKLDELIRDIEKMKLLLIRKDSASFTQQVYREIVNDYKKDNFEEMMTSRHDGKNFDIFLREGNDQGMLVLVNSDDALYVLDIVGSVALNKVTELYETLDESSEIGQQLHNFINEID